MLHRHPRDSSPSATGSHLIHWASRYDLLTKTLFFGKEQRFREEILDLAGIEPGEAVLEIGCGTGTLTLSAEAAGLETTGGRTSQRVMSYVLGTKPG